MLGRAGADIPLHRLEHPVALPDASHIRTYIGPRPPARPTDVRTFIWSLCTRCPWTICYLEDRHAMRHTIEMFDHAEEGCGPVAAAQPADGNDQADAVDEPGQLYLFGGAPRAETQLALFA